MASIMQGVRDFMAGCPYLDEFNRGIGVDFLSAKATGYVLENTPVDPIVMEYANGSMDKRFDFVFASKEPYGPDTIMNLENIEFYEHLADWLDVCTRCGTLPTLPDNLVAQEMRAEITPYLYDEMTDLARYQIQCELIYYKPAPGRDEQEAIEHD